jgi:hypothetical protein
MEYNMNTVSLKKDVIKDLGDGLILRRSSAEDADALADFNGRIHSDNGPDKPDEKVAAWTSDLLARPHPTFSPQDFTIVEDIAAGKIVSSLNLISQTWSYAGIPFKVGRPELVGTLPEYRNRGLVRAQFDVVHQWSAERGEMVQAITGIPYYYRLFSYEMAMNLGGGRQAFLANIPALADGVQETCLMRPAEAADLDFIHRLYARGCERSLVHTVWDDNLWRYELEGKSPKNVNRTELRIITDAAGTCLGFFAHPPFNWSEGTMLPATTYELEAGIPWSVVTPAVMRFLKVTGETYAVRDGDKKPFGVVGFWLGEKHPAYEAVQDRLPRARRAYAWYMRVPDLAGFLRHIRPVLDAHLAESVMAGYTGELKLTFYRSGLRFVFEKGRVQEVENWQPEPVGHSGDAAFPGLTFLQVLFGYRSVEELEYAFADCWHETDDARNLLNSMFPRHPSDLWPIA